MKTYYVAEESFEVGGEQGYDDQALQACVSRLREAISEKYPGQVEVEITEHAVNADRWNSRGQIDSAEVQEMFLDLERVSGEVTQN